MEQQLYELPEEWITKPIGEIASLVTKGSTPTSYGHKFQSSGINFVKIENITDGKIDADSISSFITEEAHQFLKRSQLQEGDLLFSIAGSIGTSALVDAAILPANTNQALALIRGYESDAIPEFLLYALRSEVLNETKDKKRGGALQNISLTDIKNTKIPLPPLNEQERIVAKLDALFTRIDAAITYLQETLKLSKALFASALDREFAALDVRFQIGDIAYVKGGKRLPKGATFQDDSTAHPYIRVADFRDDGTIELSGLKYISDETYEYIKNYTISIKDLYISIAGTIGKTGVVPEELDGANLTENAAKIVFKKQGDIDVRFVYYFTLSNDFLEQAGLATKIVAQPKLALTRLSKIEVPLPALSEQRRIVSSLDLLSEHTRALEAETKERLDQLAALKSSLLDAAFRGQL
jgi:type I restriction enzyme S subunit